MTDSVAQAETDRIRGRVREGSSLHSAIAEGGLFPPVLAQLVALGEDAGRLADFLLKAAELLERKTERTLERLVALVEPAMIVGFGGVVAVVALALLQAIYGVNAASF
jgi:type II secretory pathway component PulF